MNIQEGKATQGVEHPLLDALVVPAADAAQYVERMCGELAGLSDRAGLGFLAYLLEVAREEAVLHCDEPPRTAPVVHGELPPTKSAS